MYSGKQKEAHKKAQEKEQAREQGKVVSPCISVCQLDPGTGLCLGCLRSLDEISSWSRISQDEQRHVLAAVVLRREALRR